MGYLDDLLASRDKLSTELDKLTEKLKSVKNELSKVEKALFILQAENSRQNFFGRFELQNIILNHLGEFTLRTIKEEVITLKNIESEALKYKVSKSLAVLLNRLYKNGKLVRKKGEDSEYIYSKPWVP